MKKIKGMNIDNINPAKSAEKIEIPAYFIHAADDEMIPLEQL
eukprot:CAMPEP_0202962028 /NCGR_PEP_ID=MMETSP1396-20130829/6126_1 /ASSEMBLY_ACC=CAM_ASM_000872 /TAXON_ID= /ORGANISM="Pseudokeronopsis sp., Strain Brazil" /LENGTH=41 /DNA_ID= /DNA_START= /DNA_END= /DNA_ORIENTATION=